MKRKFLFLCCQRFIPWLNLDIFILEIFRCTLWQCSKHTYVHINYVLCSECEYGWDVVMMCAWLHAHLTRSTKCWSKYTTAIICLFSCSCRAKKKNNFPTRQRLTDSPLSNVTVTVKVKLSWSICQEIMVTDMRWAIVFLKQLLNKY